MIKIGILLASVREGRRGEGFARWIHALASQRPGVEAEILDLRDWQFGGYAHKDGTTIAEKSWPDGSLERRWFDKLSAFDAFVIVTPEYTHGYPGALKNALDHAYAPWNHKAVAFVSYGGFAAGARAVEQLRQVAIELRMVPTRDEVNVRLLGYAADEKGFPKDEIYTRRAGALFDELLWWARVTKDGRQRPASA